MEEMLCPECMGPLETTDGKTARCTLHGGDYEILFSRLGASEVLPDRGPRHAHRAAPAAGERTSTEEMTPSEAAEILELTPAEAAAFLKSSQPQSGTPEAQADAAKTCVRHPSKPAKFACRSCRALICETCAFPQADGSQLCPDCATKPARAARGTARRGNLGMHAAAPSGLRIAPGTMCVNHAEVQAVRRCKICRAPICETCIFSFLGNLHTCPKCATSAEHQGLTPKRKGYMIGSLVCAIVATLGYLFLFFGAGLLGLMRTQEDIEMIGVIALVWILGSTVPGIALASAARLPGRPRPISVWVALIWNVVLLVGFFLLMLIGSVS